MQITIEYDEESGDLSYTTHEVDYPLALLLGVLELVKYCVKEAADLQTALDHYHLRGDDDGGGK